MKEKVTKILLFMLVFNQHVFPSLLALSPSDIPKGVFYLDSQNTDGDDNPLNEPVNGSSISTLVDSFSSHTGTQLDSNKTAVYYTGAINSYPGILFDGSNDLFEINDDLDIGSGTGYSEKSFSIVFQTSSDITSGQTIYEQGGKEKGFLFHIFSGSLYAGVYNSLDWPIGEEYKIINVGALEQNTNYILIFVYDSNNDFVKAYINGTLTNTLNSVSTQTTNGACPLNGTSFGCNMYMSGGSIGLGAIKNDSLNPTTNSGITIFEGYHFEGYLGEIASWNAAITDTQSSDLTEYLMIKWGFDQILPIITSGTPNPESLIPSSEYSVNILYNDSGTGSSLIDTNSASLELYKWDGVSSWGSDISGSLIQSGAIITSTGVSYVSNQLPYGKYRYIFNISDNAGNTSLDFERIFYVDQPEFTVSAPEIDIGSVGHIENSYSTGVTVTVKTVGAPFNITLNPGNPLISGGEDIPLWDGSIGYGYENNPYTNTLNTINNNEILASQSGSININGNKNTYTYELRLGSIVEIQQAAGNYSGTVDFGINLTY